MLGEFVSTGEALSLHPAGEIIEIPDKALRCYRVGPEDLEEIYRRYGPPGFSTYRDGGRGAAKPWPPEDPAEAERIVQEALGKVKGAPRRAA